MVNQEGMEDRYYFSDWGGCICGDGPGSDPECPLLDDFDEHEEEED